MTVTSKLIWLSGALLALVAAACGSSGGGNTTGGNGCVPGTTQECACLGGTTGVQVCNSDGKGFDACQCGSTTSSGSGGATTSSSSSTSMNTCGDGVIQPSDKCDNPNSEFYCKADCEMATSSSSGTGGCGPDNHQYYTGKIDNAPSVWGNLPNAGGQTGLEAGNAACKSAVPGSDHVCDYEEIVLAAMGNQLSSIPQGTTAWLQRTTPVLVGGVTSMPGPGGRCNDWTYLTNHVGDGEYITFAQAGVPTYHFDNDTIFDPMNGAAHTIPNDLQCGGTTRSILCCYSLAGCM